MFPPSAPNKNIVAEQSSNSDQNFHNFRASISGDRRVLRGSETTCDIFWGFQFLKGSVGISLQFKVCPHVNGNKEAIWARNARLESILLVRIHFPAKLENVRIGKCQNRSKLDTFWDPEKIVRNWVDWKVSDSIPEGKHRTLILFCHPQHWQVKSRGKIRRRFFHIEHL